MDRYRAGAAAWVASAVLIPVQLIVALRWPQGYSLTDNAISDLGVTACGQFSEQGEQVRDVCSPWYPLFNIGMVLCGALVVIGGLLLHGWWNSGSGRAGTILMALSGFFVSIVGLAPWDTHPGVHDVAALGQAVAQWLAMALLAVAAGPGLFRVLSTLALVVSMAGFAGFLAALEGTEVPLLGFGGVERVSFDTLTVWTVLVGTALLRRSPSSPKPVITA